MTAPPAPDAVLRPRGRATAVFDVLVTGCVCFVLLVAYSGMRAIDSTLQARAGEFVARAVLRGGSTLEQAQATADDIRRGDPRAHVTVITPDSARSRLALQETWMQKLPDVDLGELPFVLEIRHPDYLLTRENAADLNASVAGRSDVDFVQFNGLAHEAFLRQYHLGYRAARITAVAVSMAVCITYLFLSWTLSRVRLGVAATIRPNRARFMLTVVIGCALGAAAFQLLVLGTSWHGTPSPLSGIGIMPVVVFVVLSALRFTGWMLGSRARERQFIPRAAAVESAAARRSGR